MDQAVAYSTLGLTVSLAVFRPRFGSLRFTPGTAALVGVLALFATHLLSFTDLVDAMRLQWRPLVTLTSIMVITGVVQEVGAIDRLVAWIEMRARARSAAYTFSIVFAISVITPALLNNDAAILMLTPIVVGLTRRLYPRQPALTVAFAFAVFLAPGVAPFIVSNPMNLIVAERAGLNFNSYALVMLPISIIGALLTYAILRLVYRRELGAATLGEVPIVKVHRHPAERPAVLLMLAVFVAYPVAASFDVSIWAVAVAGALAALALCRIYRVAPLRKATSHVSIDILVFLWGIFLVVQGLGKVGVIAWLAGIYHTQPVGSGGELATVGVVSALGSALIDNHPMSLLNLAAIGTAHGPRLLQAALVGGDIGPRLLPIGSLAGLLWMDLLRRQGVEIGIMRFVRVGTLVLLPTMAVSLVVLWLL